MPSCDKCARCPPSKEGASPPPRSRLIPARRTRAKRSNPASSDTWRNRWNPKRSSRKSQRSRVAPRPNRAGRDSSAHGRTSGGSNHAARRLFARCEEQSEGEAETDDMQPPLHHLRMVEHPWVEEPGDELEIQEPDERREG